MLQKTVISLLLSSLILAIGWQIKKWFYKSESNHIEISFDAAKSAIINQQNDDLKYIISANPLLLMQKDAINLNLINYAIEYMSDDLIYVTNFEAVNFILGEKLFDSSVNTFENLESSLATLVHADSQNSKMELKPFLPKEYNRSKYLFMLSKFILLTPDEKIPQFYAVDILLTICNRRHFKNGDIQDLSSATAEKIKHNIYSGDTDAAIYIKLIAVNVAAGALNENCLSQVLKGT